MTEARKQHNWDLASHLLAMIHNVNTTRGVKKPEFFNPMAKPTPKNKLMVGKDVPIEGFRNMFETFVCAGNRR